MFRRNKRPLCSAFASESGVVCEKVEVADTFFTRLLGLLGRKGLGADRGLWLSPSSGIHTFGMRFAIDVIALDAEMKVVELHRGLRAWKVAATDKRVRSVLELPVGQIDRSRVAIGEVVSIGAL